MLPEKNWKAWETHVTPRAEHHVRVMSEGAGMLWVVIGNTNLIVSCAHEITFFEDRDNAILYSTIECKLAERHSLVPRPSLS